jgi:hypothetical protein
MATKTNTNTTEQARPQVYLRAELAAKLRPMAVVDRRSLSALVGILVEEALAAREAAKGTTT